jgi:hypothetical protein
MIKIEDVVVPTKGTAKYFNLLVLNFPPNPTNVSFYWSIHQESVTPAQGETPESTSPGKVVLEGNLNMSAETYASWGQDDQYVIDWALNELGFVEVAASPE